MKKILLAGTSLLMGMGIGGTVMGGKMNRIICEKQETGEKFRIMYHMMERWMRIKQRGDSLKIYFEANEYNKIAIYGMGDIGKLLFSEMNASGIDVVYGIDKNVNATDKVKVYSPDSDLPEVDAIVVTAIAYFDDIEEMLSAKVHCPIISLEDIVYEVE